MVSCAGVLRALIGERSGFAKTEVPSCVADDQVIEQRDVEALFTKEGLAMTACRHDLSGIVRALAADLPHT